MGRRAATTRRPWRRIGSVATVVTSAGACGGSAAATCDELRAELAEFDPRPAAAWDDVADLQEDVARGLELRREIDARCREE